MKLRQLPAKSPVGVKFQFSGEYSLPFHMGAPPPPTPISKCLTGSEGVMEWWSDGVKSAHHYNLEKFSKLKIVPYHGDSPNTRNDVRLQSPSPIMAPGRY